MVMMSSFLNEMATTAWLFASSNSVSGIEQVNTGELSDWLDFWLIGYKRILGLDLASDCNVDVFSSSWIRKSSKIFFWNADTWWFENDTEFLGSFRFLTENYVASSYFFLVARKAIWFGNHQSRDPCRQHQGWPTRLGCLSWSHRSPLRWSLHEHG